MLIDNFSENFLSKMWGMGYTQKEVCDITGRSRSAVFNLLNGNTVLISPTAVQIAEAIGYNVEVRIVAIGDEEMNRYKGGTLGENRMRAKRARRRIELKSDKLNENAKLGKDGIAYLKSIAKDGDV